MGLGGVLNRDDGHFDQTHGHCDHADGRFEMRTDTYTNEAAG